MFHRTTVLCYQIFLRPLSVCIYCFCSICLLRTPFCGSAMRASSRCSRSCEWVFHSCIFTAHTCNLALQGCKTGAHICGVGLHGCFAIPHICAVRCIIRRGRCRPARARRRPASCPCCIVRTLLAGFYCPRRQHFLQPRRNKFPLSSLSLQTTTKIGTL